jgi:hypothetical protein
MSKSMIAAGVLVFVGAPLSAGAQSTGVPRLDPDYSVEVDVWWASHPFNPESPRYSPSITSPSPVVNLTSGQSIQAAIDGLPAAGGTIRLGPGSYGGFDVIGRSNVHVVSDGGAVIAGIVRLSVSSRALDYGTFDSLIRQGDAAAWNDLRNPTRNFYFKNLIFDGGGARPTGVVLKRVYDVVFDDCEFRNFVDPRSGHPGIVGGHMGLNNIWYRNCRFRGSCRWVSYLDGAHGSGAIGCTIELSNFGSGGFLYLTNDDFTEDINGNGRTDREEERNAKYIVIYGNLFEGGNTDNAVSITGENLLVRKNRVTGAINRFVGCQTRWSHSDSSLRYSFYVFKILENTVADCVLEFLTLENNANPAPAPYQSPVMGRYTVRCNSFNVRTGRIVNDDDGPIEGPNVVADNCVNDPACTPSCGASDTPPPSDSPPPSETPTPNDRSSGDDKDRCGATGLETVLILGLAALVRARSRHAWILLLSVGAAVTGCSCSNDSNDSSAAMEPEPPPPSPPPPPNPSLLAQDSFSGQDGTPLESHSPDQGNAWSVHFGSFALRGNQAANTSIPACATMDVGRNHVLVEAKITLPTTAPPNGQGDWFVSLVAATEIRTRLWDGVEARFLWQGGSPEIEIWEFAEGGTYFAHPGLGMGFRNIRGRLQPGGTYTLRLWVNGRSAVAAIAGDELLTTCVTALGRDHTSPRAGLNVDDGGGYARWDDFQVFSLADSEPPQAPGNLRVTGKTRTSVSLAWNPSADNGTVVRYQINRNGYVQVGTAAGTEFTDAGHIHSVSPGTTYTYFVRAIDQDGNLSPSSNVVSVTTDP